MELVSANIGLPLEVTWQGRSVTTAIGKQTVEGRVALCKLNLVGNRQGDLSVHGERIKPPSATQLHSYGYWKWELPGHNSNPILPRCGAG